MNRIFPVLACLAIAFIVVNAIIGLNLDELRPDASQETKTWATVHRLCGVAAALAVVLVDSIVVTYFIGTSRWCKEVADRYGKYGFDERHSARCTMLKRRAFPWSLASILTAVAMVALGGAADPAAAMRIPPIGGVTWTQLHLIGAFVGLAIIVWCAFRQWTNLYEQVEVIAQVVAETNRIRQEGAVAKAQKASLASSAESNKDGMELH